jgi:hypothetical protein
MDIILFFFLIKMNIDNVVINQMLTQDNNYNLIKDFSNPTFVFVLYFIGEDKGKKLVSKVLGFL